MTLRLSRLPDPALFSRGGVARLLAALNGDGEETRVAGGAVRNALLGLPVNDVDCATTAVPDETMRRAEGAGFRCVPTGLAHGTVTVLVDHEPFEVTTLRADVATDGRRATVSFGRDFAADAARRDFTINALYASRDGVVTDHVGGLEDLAARRVRFIGDAQTRIREDYLRILRLFRFHARYGEGEIDAAALSACIRERDGLDILSRERVRAELVKILSARRAVEAVRIMGETGLLARVLGGVANHARFEAGATRPAAPLAAAQRLGLLAVECLDDAARLRARLSLTNEESDVLNRVARLSQALRAAGFRMAPAAARALLYRLGGDLAGALAVCLAAAGAPAVAIGAGPDPAFWAPPALPWRGADALAAGLSAGPAVGEALARAEQAWIDADFTDDPAALAAIWDEALQGG